MMPITIRQKLFSFRNNVKPSGIAVNVILMAVSYGCATSTTVEQLRLKSGSPVIEVHTKDGGMYNLEEWKINNDGSIAGMVLTESMKRTGITIQSHSIKKIYVQKEGAKETEMIVTVTGSIVFAAVVIAVIYYAPQFAFNIGGGR